jgi:hypothetical protein
MVVQLNRECKLLQGQLDKYGTTTTTNVNSEAKVSFVDSISPMIKNAMFDVAIFVPVCHHYAPYHSKQVYCR